MGNSDLVLIVRTDDGMQHLLQSKFKLGADASAAAGPVGRDAQAMTDLTLRAQVLTYSRSRGLFLGVSLSGGVIKQDQADTQAFYGKDWSFYSLLNGRLTSQGCRSSFADGGEVRPDPSPQSCPGYRWGHRSGARIGSASGASSSCVLAPVTTAAAASPTSANSADQDEDPAIDSSEAVPPTPAATTAQSTAPEPTTGVMGTPDAAPPGDSRLYAGSDFESDSNSYSRARSDIDDGNARRTLIQVRRFASGGRGHRFCIVRGFQV